MQPATESSRNRSRPIYWTNQIELFKSHSRTTEKKRYLELRRILGLIQGAARGVYQDNHRLSQRRRDNLTLADNVLGEVNVKDEENSRTDSSNSDIFVHGDNTLMGEESFKICPFCAEKIRASAIKCKHCHETITVKDDKPKPKPEGKGEKILFSLHPVWHSYSWQLFIGVLLLPLFGAGLIAFFKTFFQRHSVKYVLMTNKIIVHQGFLNRTTESFNLNKINTMVLKQTPMQRILKSGDVILSVPGKTIQVERITHPEKFIETINKYK